MNKRKKILYCTPYDLSTGSGIARCSRHIINYYNELNSPKYELKLLPMDRFSSAEGKFKFIKRVLYGLSDYSKIIKNIKIELNKNNYDIVHIASSASISLFKDYLCLKMLRKKNIASIIHFHFGRIPELAKANNWEWKFILKIALLASKIIVIDQASYDTLKNNGITNVDYLPNPLSPDVEKIIEQYHNIDRNDNTILFVGHVIRTKGVYELAEACSLIENINLKVIGLYNDVVKNDLLEIYNNNNNISKIEFTGNIPAQNVIKEMLSCSVFVLPTYTEGFPNVILESMACSCPIITTNVGAIPEMLDIDNKDVYGICIKPKHIIELKDSIIKMLTDNNFATSCGINAQRRVKEMYSINVIWAKMDKIWDTAIYK